MSKPKVFDGPAERLRRIWRHMNYRCSDVRNGNYVLYGARGIAVCNNWRDDFWTFYAWAIQNGYEEYLTIDRINNDGNYSPDNCRWVTRREQQRNRRDRHNVEYRGKTQLLSDWAREYGVAVNVLANRIVRYNWSMERALTTPVIHNVI